MLVLYPESKSIPTLRIDSLTTFGDIAAEDIVSTLFSLFIYIMIAHSPNTSFFPMAYGEAVLLAGARKSPTLGVPGFYSFAGEGEERPLWEKGGVVPWTPIM